MGFLVKLDTNGSKTAVLQELIEKQLIDYVALDFKAMPAHFKKITKSDFFLPFEKSLDLLIESKLSFEVRTTLHSDLIDVNHAKEIIHYLEQHNYRGNYYIQHFMNGATTLGKLGYSTREVEHINLSTANIKVHFRGK